MLLLAGAALVAGCELRAEAVVEVDRDGAGAFELRLAGDQRLEQVAADAGIDPFGDVVAAVERAAGGGAGASGEVGDAAGKEGEAARWLVDDTRPDDPAWAREVTVRVEADDAATLRAEVGALTDALAAAELVPLADVDVAVTDDTVAATAGASLEPTPTVEELGLTVGEAEALLAEHVDYVVEVQLPAEVTAAPGAEVDGRRARWEVPAGSSVTVEAVSPRPVDWWSSPLVWGLAGGALLVGVALAVAGGLLLRRARARRRAG